MVRNKIEKIGIDIAFCVNDAYVPYITVTIKSIAENNRGRNIHIHVLTDAIRDISRRRLHEVVEMYDNISLHIHIVDDSLLRHLKITDNWPIHAWYRILLPDIIPEDVKTVLYLDADTLVTADLSNIFALDMTGKAVAGALDLQSFFEKTYVRCGYDPCKQYLCSGVLLLNLDYWRKYKLTKQIIDWARQNHELIKCPDQDSINVLCQDAKIVLPLQYGFMHCFCENEIFYRDPYRAELEACIERPAIIHYCGCPPWGREYRKHILHHEWEKYNRMLRHPVRRVYQVKGLLKLKVMIWDLLHLYGGRRQLSIAQVRDRLQQSC